MTRLSLTGRQRTVFEYVKECIASGYAPTCRELARHFGISRQGAHVHVVALVRKGYVRRIFGDNRSIRLALDDGAPSAQSDGGPRCGRCGTRGHDRRTCDASDEDAAAYTDERLERRRLRNRDRARARSGSTKTYACSRCGKRGHNMRSCQEPVRRA